LKKQALWCGIGPGMRVLDVACGPGKTTALLYEMIQPAGSIVGIDYSTTRLAYAREHYGGKDRISFQQQDLLESMEGLGEFDFIWVRFVLEYYRKEASDIVKNLIHCLKPGGYLCLLDLDFNCLIHHELSQPMSEILAQIMKTIDEQYNFDTHIGRKLYSFLYDNGLQNIDVEMMAHNLIFGEMKDKDKYNLTKKLEIAGDKVEKLISTYEGGYRQFLTDFEKYLADPRRFTYTPLLLCKGMKSLSG
jgi:ubiquinone/menaquinone biosynthesis C-methylase UbiE